VKELSLGKFCLTMNPLSGKKTIIVTAEIVGSFIYIISVIETTLYK
jgi:hypothetical protein